MRALIVEDHQIVRYSVKAMLEFEAEAEVVGETSLSHEALKLAATRRPDLVVLDWILQDGDAGELCRALKALHDDPRVLVHSAFNSAEVVKECRRAGADGFVTKNADNQEFLEAAVSTLGGGSPWLTDAGGDFYELHPVVTPRKPALTPTEQRVYSLMIRHYSDSQIADELSVTLNTVHTHERNVRQKLKVKRKRDLF